MSERDKLFLGHILGAIDDICSFTADGRPAFMSDRKTQSAVVRQLEIIGEAVKQISSETTALAPGVPWRLIAGTRDRLIHAYFNVNLHAVRAMVEQNLPPLRHQVVQLVATPDRSA
jgi:uncharacterized protein with HEPN domain